MIDLIIAIELGLLLVVNILGLIIKLSPDKIEPIIHIHNELPGYVEKERASSNVRHSPELGYKINTEEKPEIAIPDFNLPTSSSVKIEEKKYVKSK